MSVVGIDPGGHGAVSVFDDEGRQLLEVVDIPTTREANGRSATNAPLLAGILARANARVAFCEFVAARPTDAKVSAFSFGRARGVIEGVCGALGLPIVFLVPRVMEARGRTFLRASRTRISRGRGQSLDGLRTPISSPANATSTAPRRA